MKDKEIVTAIATGVMEWERARFGAPPSWGRWDRDESGKKVRWVCYEFCSDWNPLTDDRAWAQVLDKMAECGSTSFRRPRTL